MLMKTKGVILSKPSQSNERIAVNANINDAIDFLVIDFQRRIYPPSFLYASLEIGEPDGQMFEVVSCEAELV